MYGPKPHASKLTLFIVICVMAAGAWFSIGYQQVCGGCIFLLVLVCCAAGLTFKLDRDISTEKQNRQVVQQLPQPLPPPPLTNTSDSGLFVPDGPPPSH